MDYEELLNKYSRLKADFIELVMKSQHICNFCKHNFECKDKNGCFDNNNKGFEWRGNT